MKKRLKQLLCVFLVMMVTVGLVGCSSKPKGFTPGTYTTETRGQHDMTITVTVSETEILDIIVDHKETPGVGEPAVEPIISRIIAAQGLGVDAISGATITSEAIIEGVADCLKQAGGDIEALRAIKYNEDLVREADIVLETDVVVIGAGGAGLAAAVTANENGSTVIVVEKEGKVGGNTILAGGALNAVDEGSETAIANKDSVEHHFNQTFEGGDKLANPELVRTLVENAWDGVEWLKGMGMEFEPGTFTVLGGMWPRAHKPSEPVGTGFFKTYMEYIDTHDNIEVILNTRATELIVEDGVVVGVICTGRTGNEVKIYAKSVILATGGFGRNIEMREEYNTFWKTLDESILSTNHPGATGDGIAMALEVDAALVGMEHIQLLPLGDPVTGSLSGNIETDVERRIFVNKEGNRFVDEGARRDVMTAALFEQTDAMLFIILDGKNYENSDSLNNFGESIGELVAAGRAYQADTLEELAEQIGVPAENLIAAVEEFNSHVDNKTTDQFGRTLYSTKIDQAPYYACIRVPTLHHTMGGVEINTSGQVINESGEVIPGLYAAGEVTGGVHGSNRLGGNALTDILVFGRIAGKSASDAANEMDK